MIKFTCVSVVALLLLGCSAERVSYSSALSPSRQASDTVKIVSVEDQALEAIEITPTNFAVSFADDSY
ncbi:MAG: hypothetical protein KDD53_09035, partial [Bdellovibrionales bacterium]|nr:hypothetical protein [Bdellovibrionales bacterium]